MTDVKALEAAAARLEADASLPDRIAAEVRRLAGFVRREHPAGYQHVDHVLDAGLREASAFGRGPEMLLSVERLQRRMEELRIEADAETARRAKLADDAALQRRFALQAGGCIGRPHRDAAILEAARIVRQRVEAVGGRLANAANEAEFGAALDDLDAAGKSFASAIGVARRACCLRASADAARAAVATAAPALAA